MHDLNYYVKGHIDKKTNTAFHFLDCLLQNFGSCREKNRRFSSLCRLVAVLEVAVVVVVGSNHVVGTVVVSGLRSKFTASVNSATARCCSAVILDQLNFRLFNYFLYVIIIIFIRYHNYLRHNVI